MRQHHERVDGRGYPDGLTDILQGAQVIALGDVFDALTSSRPYRAGESPGKALRMIEMGKAGAFEPELLTTFITMLRSEHGLEDWKAE